MVTEPAALHERNDVNGHRHRIGPRVVAWSCASAEDISAARRDARCRSVEVAAVVTVVVDNVSRERVDTRRRPVQIGLDPRVRLGPTPSVRRRRLIVTRPAGHQPLAFFGW
jgi:hypothetical protein